MRIPLAYSEHRRGVAASPDVRLRNRFVEPNPVLHEGEESLSFIQRPALHRWAAVGTGPIRTIFHQAGAFGDDLFVVSNSILYRTTEYGVSSTIAINLFGGDDAGSPVSFACTGEIGTIPPRLFFADGQTLRVYTEEGFASGTLTASAVPANSDTVVIGGIYYRFTTGAVDTGTPAGTNVAPWLIHIVPGSTTQTLDNLMAAINGTGTPGVDYSTLCTPHLAVAAEVVSGNFIRVRALEAGIGGNGITTTETGANMAWSAGTLANGGTAGTTLVPTPEGIGVISVGFINGFVIVIPAQGEGVNGRFYWIEPGETTIDPLNYATAERSADPVTRVVIFSDQFWLPGQDSTETWFITGAIEAPVQRVQGILFDRGTVSGTGRQVKDSMIIVSNDGGVFQIRGGTEKRISTPDVEERIRRAIAAQAAYTI